LRIAVGGNRALLGDDADRGVGADDAIDGGVAEIEAAVAQDGRTATVQIAAAASVSAVVMNHFIVAVGDRSGRPGDLQTEQGNLAIGGGTVADQPPLAGFGCLGGFRLDQLVEPVGVVAAALGQLLIAAAADLAGEHADGGPHQRGAGDHGDQQLHQGESRRPAAPAPSLMPADRPGEHCWPGQALPGRPGMAVAPAIHLAADGGVQRLQQHRLSHGVGRCRRDGLSGSAIGRCCWKAPIGRSVAKPCGAELVSRAIELTR